MRKVILNPSLWFALLMLPPMQVEAQSQDVPRVGTYVATRMSQNGVADKDRLFIFYFDYFNGINSPTCIYQSVTVNNLSCSTSGNATMSRDGGFWVKPEFCNAQHCGDEFRCTARRIEDRRIELTVNVPIGILEGEVIHRLIVDEFGSNVLDYSGTLSKFSRITKRTETATYTALKGGVGFEDVKVGCAKMAVPVVPASRK